MDETTITGTLPHLPNMPNVTVRISHRADPDGGAETVTIQVQASPDFQTGLPLLGSFAGLAAPAAFPITFMDTLGGGASPFALWDQMIQAWLEPWAALARFNPLLSPGDQYLR